MTTIQWTLLITVLTSGIALAEPGQDLSELKYEDLDLSEVRLEPQTGTASSAADKAVEMVTSEGPTQRLAQPVQGRLGRARVA